MLTLDGAIAMAAAVHAGQVDERGDSYLLHPLRVMLAVPAEAKIAAVLHDVVEKSETTLEDLAAAGVDHVSLAAIDLLTKRPRARYDKYVERIARAEGEPGRIARVVKLADVEDKLSRLPAASNRRARLERALALLRADGLAWTRVSAGGRPRRRPATSSPGMS